MEQRKRYPSDLQIRRPAPDEWAIIHPNEAFRWENLWAYEKDRKFYLLSPALYDQLEGNVRRVFAEHDFYLAAVRNADPIIWKVKHSDTEWFRTIRCAVEAAMTNWVQVQSNDGAKLYNFKHPHAAYPAPDWSQYQTADDAQKLFTAVFTNQVITQLDHDVLERIRGRK
jgi:hypothetical protein